MEHKSGQKIDPALTLGMQMPQRELAKSVELATGYEAENDIWEVILRYRGELEKISERHPKAIFTKLKNQYAIGQMSASMIQVLATDEDIIYMEKPKQLYYEYRKGFPKYVNTLSNGMYGQRAVPSQYTGKGVLVAVIDTGINLEEMQFRNLDGTSRVMTLWDQMTDKEYQKEEIDTLLQKNDPFRLPGKDTKGHGNDVAAIAAGKQGVAPDSNLLIVKMGMSKHQSFPRTTNLLSAIDYCIEKASIWKMPVAINVSFGNNYGSHAGDSLLESYLNSVAIMERLVICVGSGNEGLGNTHAEGFLTDDQWQEVEFVISEYETSISIQFWKNYYDEMELAIISPSGEQIANMRDNSQIGRYQYRDTVIQSIYGEPAPYTMQQEIYMDFTTRGTQIDAGIWKLRIIAGRIKDGKYDVYLPALSALNEGTQFTKAASNRTCTIPSTAQNVISVGAYNHRTDAVAPFSGRGYAARVGSVAISKPDLIAPGVEIVLPDGHTATGTSFATPFVTGRAAQLMEYGIVRLHDPYLYGAKLKAQLIKETTKMPGYQTYPSEQIGWGKLRME